MSKHTPWPWHIDGLLKTAINAGDKHIAMVNYNQRTISADEHTANVNLFLASPILLEACKSALALIDISTDYKDMTTSRELKRAIKFAETGILDHDQP